MFVKLFRHASQRAASEHSSVTVSTESAGGPAPLVEMAGDASCYAPTPESVNSGEGASERDGVLGMPTKSAEQHITSLGTATTAAWSERSATADTRRAARPDDDVIDVILGRLFDPLMSTRGSLAPAPTRALGAMQDPRHQPKTHAACSPTESRQLPEARLVFVPELMPSACL